MESLFKALDYLRKVGEIVSSVRGALSSVVFSGSGNLKLLETT